MFRPDEHADPALDVVRLGTVALYAAYGSNMDPAQMSARCPHSPQQGTGWLEGWRLTFGGEDIGWDGALTTVVEDAPERVFVVLYDVPEVDEKELDTWDGVTLGYYRKLKVRVQTLDGDALAWLYVLDAYEGGLPSARHMSILVDAAIKAGAPSDYVDWLRARPSNPALRPAPPRYGVSGRYRRITSTSTRAGTPIAANAGQDHVLSNFAAPTSVPEARAASARFLSTLMTRSASPGSGAGAGAGGEAAKRAGPAPSPPSGTPRRGRARRCARTCALTCRRRDELMAQA